MKANGITAVGIDYTDIYLGTREIKAGGINNFLGPKISVGKGKCVFDENFVKKRERVRLNKIFPTHLPDKILVCYGDKTFPPNFLKRDYEFLAVDFANSWSTLVKPQFKPIVDLWAEKANLLLFSVESFPNSSNFHHLHIWYTNCLFHHAKGVYYKGEWEGFVPNKFYIKGLRNTIGAGDTMASFLLNSLPITPASINLAQKKTAEYLRKLNE